MAYSEKQLGPQPTYIQRVGEVLGAMMEGYGITQTQIAKRDRASEQIVALGVALDEITDPIIREMYADLAESGLTDAELSVLEIQRDMAYLELGATEQALRESVAHYKQYVGRIMVGRTVSVRILDAFQPLQRPGDNHGTPMPSEITGRFAGYDPASAILRIAAAEDTYPVRLYKPDPSVPNKIHHAAIITSIDFPESAGIHFSTS